MGAGFTAGSPVGDGGAGADFAAGGFALGESMVRRASRTKHASGRQPVYRRPQDSTVAASRDGGLHDGQSRKRRKREYGSTELSGWGSAAHAGAWRGGSRR